VDIEPFTRDRLRGLQEQLAGVAPGVNWVEPDNMHLTLIFLGEVDARETPHVCKAVAEAAKPFAPFSFSVAGLGAFPTPRRPRTLIARVDEGAAELSAIHAALEPALLALGSYRREERAFTPHLTLGRVKRESAGEDLSAAIAKFSTWRGGTNHVRELKVLSSELTRDGPDYALLSRARLSG
jgi:2'-5' RNA ligase